jgi:acyl dehydratase
MALDWPTLQPGSAGPNVDLPPITHDQLIRYAGALGEFNAVHQDPVAAKAAGYPDVFAQGMLVGGILAQQIQDWAEPARLKNYRVRFLNPAFRGDRLSIRTRITSVELTATPHVVELEAEVMNQDNLILTRAWAVVATEFD